MTTNFHEWETDPLFYVAEQVQESADKLESVHRTYKSISNRKEDNFYDAQLQADLDFCRRQLRTALSTAKWQLEEFEKAASSGKYNINSRRESAQKAAAKENDRRKQFTDIIRVQIAGIEDEISHILNTTTVLNMKSPDNIVRESNDELALFLSGTSGTMKNAADKVQADACKYNSAPYRVDRNYDHRKLQFLDKFEEVNFRDLADVDVESGHEQPCSRTNVIYNKQYYCSQNNIGHNMRLRSTSLMNRITKLVHKKPHMKFLTFIILLLGIGLLVPMIMILHLYTP